MPLKILDVLALIFAAPIMITISDKISDISSRISNCVYIYVSLPPTTIYYLFLCLCGNGVSRRRYHWHG